MRVKKFMTPKDKMIWCTPDSKLGDAAKVMVERNISCIVVCKEDGKQLIPNGLLSKTDVIKACVLDGVSKDETIEKYMTHGVVTVDGDMDKNEVSLVIQEQKLHHVIVVDTQSKELIGVVSAWDIAREVALDAKAWPYNREIGLYY